jgi:hypothetical protein
MDQHPSRFDLLMLVLALAGPVLALLLVLLR